MKKNPAALIFDLNGTMIDDMNYHIDAWHVILNNLGAGLSRDKVKEECYGKNNEMLERIFPSRFSLEEMNTMSLKKELAYQQSFKPKLKLLDGLNEFLEYAHKKSIKMAIASAAIQSNVDFVLDGTNIRNYFSAIITAENVKVSKPDPTCFLKAAEDLTVDPADCLVFEDTPKGVEAALNAGMKALVITTIHEPAEFEQYSNVIGFHKDYTGLLRMLDQAVSAG